MVCKPRTYQIMCYIPLGYCVIWLIYPNLLCVGILFCKNVLCHWKRNTYFEFYKFVVNCTIRLYNTTFISISIKSVLYFMKYQQFKNWLYWKWYQNIVSYDVFVVENIHATDIPQWWSLFLKCQSSNLGELLLNTMKIETD